MYLTIQVKHQIWCLFFSTKANKNKMDITRVFPVLNQLDNFIN